MTINQYITVSAHKPACPKEECRCKSARADNEDRWCNMRWHIPLLNEYHLDAATIPKYAEWQHQMVLNPEVFARSSAAPADEARHCARNGPEANDIEAQYEFDHSSFRTIDRQAEARAQDAFDDSFEAQAEEADRTINEEDEERLGRPAGARLGKRSAARAGFFASIVGPAEGLPQQRTSQSPLGPPTRSALSSGSS
jgi:hypothetical protein